MQLLKNIIINNNFIYRFLLPIINLKRNFMLRTFRSYDKLFSNVVGGSMIVNLNNIPGVFEIDSRSHILKEILIKKGYEPKIVNAITKNTNVNQDAINIGANIGLYSNLLADLINSDKKVLAIEPTPGAIQYLETNIKHNNNHNKIIVYKGIATDSPGLSKINIIEGKEEYSSVGDISHFAVEKEKPISMDIQGETLDNLVTKFNLQPGIIVIDVEGYELQVLNGAIETIRKFKPIIISELDDKLLKNLNTTSFQVVQLFEKNGYSVNDLENRKVRFPFRGGNVIASPNCQQT